MTQNTTYLTAAEHALSRWLEMWNTSGDLAREICSDDFRIHFTLFEPEGSSVRLRQEIRGFQLERITRLEITDERPPQRDPALLEADLSLWSTRSLGGHLSV